LTSKGTYVKVASLTRLVGHKKEGGGLPSPDPYIKNINRNNKIDLQYHILVIVFCIGTASLPPGAL